MNTTLQKLTFGLKTMIKKNSVILHENPESGCLCCGGSLHSLSLQELTDLATNVHTVGDAVIRFKGDKKQLYGLIIQDKCIHYDGYKIPNYLCKHLIKEEQFGDMLVFKEKEMANDFHEMCKELIKTEE